MPKNLGQLGALKILLRGADPARRSAGRSVRKETSPLLSGIRSAGYIKIECRAYPTRSRLLAGQPGAVANPAEEIERWCRRWARPGCHYQEIPFYDAVR